MIEPSSADHSVATLNGNGVCRLPLLATNATEKSLVRRARSIAKETEAEAGKLNARLGGWEFEIPDYKYGAIFRPLDELLKKPPEPEKKAARTPPPRKAATPGKTGKAGASDKATPDKDTATPQ